MILNPIHSSTVIGKAIDVAKSINYFNNSIKPE